jgi:hypothetical protein
LKPSTRLEVLARSDTKVPEQTKLSSPSTAIHLDQLCNLSSAAQMPILTKTTSHNFSAQILSVERKIDLKGKECFDGAESLLMYSTMLAVYADG